MQQRTTTTNTGLAAGQLPACAAIANAKSQIAAGADAAALVRQFAALLTVPAILIALTIGLSGLPAREVPTSGQLVLACVALQLLSTSMLLALKLARGDLRELLTITRQVAGTDLALRRRVHICDVATGTAATWSTACTLTTAALLWLPPVPATAALAVAVPWFVRAALIAHVLRTAPRGSQAPQGAVAEASPIGRVLRLAHRNPAFLEQARRAEFN